jgi:hypothetical protein
MMTDKLYCYNLPPAEMILARAFWRSFKYKHDAKLNLSGFTESLITKFIDLMLDAHCQITRHISTANPKTHDYLLIYRPENYCPEYPWID